MNLIVRFIYSPNAFLVSTETANLSTLMNIFIFFLYGSWSQVVRFCIEFCNWKDAIWQQVSKEKHPILLLDQHAVNYWDYLV